MGFKEWAEREVRIFSHVKGRTDFERKGARAAFEAIIEVIGDEPDHPRRCKHSKSTVSNTWEKLLKGKPLTPITEGDFVLKNYFGEAIEFEDEGRMSAAEMKSFKRCPRMYSLSRTEFYDGRILYSDRDRVQLYDPKRKVKIIGVPDDLMLYIDENFPITLPYDGENIEVICQSFSSAADIDYDTVKTICVRGRGQQIYVDRYYKRNGKYGPLFEITNLEYEERIYVE